VKWRSTIVGAGLLCYISGLQLPASAGGVKGSSVDMEAPRYSSVVKQLRNASVPLKELIDGEGRVSVTLAAGRLVAMAFSGEGPNLFWSNPQIWNTEIVRSTPNGLVGGFGGDRLWLSPEVDYHWDGKPDWEELKNYKTQPDIDPGNYHFVDVGEKRIRLEATGVLNARASHEARVGFEVHRTIRMVEPPLPKTNPLMREIQYVGVETTNSLRLTHSTNDGRLDLWHLLQMPIGSALIVPLRTSATKAERTPLSYGLPGGWVEKPNHIFWIYEGKAHAKFGLPANALTGRTAVVSRLDDLRWYLIVREFAVDRQAVYGDHPYGILRDDQAFQAWDGFGFGEMEFHSPVLDARTGPRTITELDRLWAFAGQAHAIALLGMQLLGVDISDVLR
jgi:hypothetical protein